MTGNVRYATLRQRPPLSGLSASHVCWLFGEECGAGLLYSRDGINPTMLPVHAPDFSQNLMGPLLAEQLEPAH
jgi:hypothetical protein